MIIYSFRIKTIQICSPLFKPACSTAAAALCIQSAGEATGEDARGYEPPCTTDELQHEESTKREFTEEDAWRGGGKGEEGEEWKE